MRGMRSVRKFTSPLVSAHHNIKNNALHVEMHGRRFLAALESGNDDLAEREATELYCWAKQAVWAGNLVLNAGRPVREVTEELEAELREKKLRAKADLPEVRILMALANLVHCAEAQRRESRLLEELPDYGSREARVRFEVKKERWEGEKRCLVTAIAETDLDPEFVALLASGAQYERAAGFIRRNAGWIEQERQQRQLRERIAAERGQEFCLNCGQESDGSYCGSICLEQHLSAEIEASGLPLDCFVATAA